MARQHESKSRIEPPLQKEPRAKSLLILLPLLAGLLAAGGVCLHAIGAIAHRTFLNEMGVPSDLFPKDAAWMLVNGFYAVFNRWYLLFKVYADRPWEFVLYCIALSAILLTYLYLYRLSPKKSEWIDKMAPWRKAAIRFVALCLAIAGTIPGAVCVVILLMIAIGAPGEYAGKAYAEKIRDRHANGCSAQAPCTDVRNSAELVLTGVVLDASPSHLAIYDPKTRLSYVLPIQGLELRHIALYPLAKASDKK